eukprot:TRINITY_DN10508_c0_g3_i1.p1 TRINITY_DN10508_c0_g3~~TRINITY_DN10508_c0_g3_i1.p1  ORF type:complete len:316 (+),score=85.76 TRINITY_DN10508_c0_g3_i1:367-1314(+)
MMKKLDRRLYDLARRNPLAVKGLNKISLSSFPIIERIPDENVKEEIMGLFSRRLYQAGDMIVKKGEHSAGLMIVLRGMATLRISDQFLECLSTGGMIHCWNALRTNETYFTDVRAETFVEVASLDFEMLPTALGVPQVFDELWRTASAEVIKLFFTDYFHGLSGSDVGNLCFISRLFKSEDPQQVETFQYGGILLTGQLILYDDMKADDEEMANKPLLSPLLILPGCKCRVESDSLVMSFAPDKWVPTKVGVGVVRPEDLQSYLDKHSPPKVFLGSIETLNSPTSIFTEEEESKSSNHAHAPRPTGDFQEHHSLV